MITVLANYTTGNALLPGKALARTVPQLEPEETGQAIGAARAFALVIPSLKLPA